MRLVRQITDLLPIQIMASDNSRYYKTLGLSSDATPQETKNAFLRQCLKWHPEKNKRLGAKKKFAEVTEAYEALVAPTVHRVKSGHVIAVSLHPNGLDSQDGALSTFFGRFNIINWFRPSAKSSVSTKVDNAFELLSEYMYDGDFGDFFTDADNTLHVIVNIQLARALIGGTVSYKIPTETKSEIIHTEEISGILSGYWRPMRRITINGRQVWVIFKVNFPKDMSDEDQIELRQKLLFAQTTAAILPAIWSWLTSHPKISTLGVLSLVIGGGAMLRRSSLFQIGRIWAM